jgi:ribosomal peptide maturation radical SAM protein 1
VLVVPPFASAALPILGPSVLAAAALDAGISTRVAYANLRFAARVGYARYRRFALSTSRMHGEMLFREPAFGAPAELRDDDFEDRDDAVSAADFEAARSELPEFVDEIADRIASWTPSVVGFSSVFQQNLASIGLARALRLRLPEAVLVLGGANAARPMAGALASVTDAFDLIVSGEADLAFVGLIRDLMAGGRKHAAALGPVLDVGPVTSLDDAAIPRYDDYFATVAELDELPDGLPIALPFESSRGCWWGQRSHCTFCGLNALEMTQRDKSPARILAEIDELRRRHPQIGELRASDNILPFPVLREVLPVLASRRASDLAADQASVTFFYEVKSSLKRRDLDLLAAAGVERVQPGIESLSSRVLKRIRKGSNGPDNLVFLREALGAGVSLLWNLMVGFPDDVREDYEAILRLIPLVEHLQPPVALAPMRVDRYSPYHQRPQEFGIERIEPLPGMDRIYPPGAPLMDLAYHFEGTLKSPYRDDPVLGRRITARIAGWHARWSAPEGRPVLQFSDDEIIDTRHSAIQRRTVLPARALELLRVLDKPARWERVEEEADPGALADLLHRGFVVQHEDKLLSVVVRPSR